MIQGEGLLLLILGVGALGYSASLTPGAAEISRRTI